MAHPTSGFMHNSKNHLSDGLIVNVAMPLPEVEYERSAIQPPVAQQCNGCSIHCPMHLVFGPNPRLPPAGYQIPVFGSLDRVAFSQASSSNTSTSYDQVLGDSTTFLGSPHEGIRLHGNYGDNAAPILYEDSSFEGVINSPRSVNVGFSTIPAMTPPVENILYNPAGLHTDILSSDSALSLGPCSQPSFVTTFSAGAARFQADENSPGVNALAGITRGFRGATCPGPIPSLKRASVAPLMTARHSHSFWDGVSMDTV
ncbi:hypothetical protein C8Q79DRAFT_929879 [Trametes meyenii]|nr:hypothetical protein C8Q79DRAFT_929879 [Trametes meyenii]